MNCQRFQQIEDIYQSLNVYRSLIVYDNADEFTPLKELLIKNDYPIINGDYGRMYTFERGELDLNSVDIQWDTISVVICLDDMSFDYIKDIINKFPILILLIKI